MRRRRARWLPYLGIAMASSSALADPVVPAVGPIEPKPPIGAASPALAATPEPALDPKNLPSLIADPVLAKADRVDGNEATGIVAFTFDDGPSPETTPHVIDALEHYDVPAAFFVVTRRLVGVHGDAGRALLARELDDGFIVGSHSISHINLRKAAAPLVVREIEGSIRTLAPQAHRPIGLFRPPYGALGFAGAKELHKLGLTDVRWSIDTRDWQAHRPDRLRAKVLTMILKHNGGVVLMHDSKPITAAVIAGVLDDLEAENCRRLAAGEPTIIPVSLHYFLTEHRAARPIPELVERRTESYRAGLATRCAARSSGATSESGSMAK